MSRWLRESADGDKWLGDTKGLDQIGKERQELSDAPKPEPLPPAVVAPAEPIPYKEIKPLLENSVKAILDSTLGLHKAGIAIAKVLAVLPSAGMESQGITEKLKDFKDDVDYLGERSEEISKDIAAYCKDGIPSESKQ